MSFKTKYGEVLTTEKGVNYLLDQLPEECWCNPNLTWFDMGSGTGNIISEIVKRLDRGLEKVFTLVDERDKHIREKMIYVSEINPYHRETLLKITENIYDDVFKIKDKTFDIVVSNPPYVIEGRKKVPSRRSISKKNDGKTIWPAFVDKGFQLCELYCCLIIPLIIPFNFLNA